MLTTMIITRSLALS